jgi:hypothetical protein
MVGDLTDAGGLRLEKLTRTTRSAVKHRPADVVPQPLVVKHELANRLRELVTLPLALDSPCGFALRRSSTYGLDRIGGRTELVRGDVIRISEGPTAADRHEARAPDLREDHG